jgi:hypothetical protein
VSSLVVVRGTTEIAVALPSGETTVVVVPTASRTELIVNGGPPGPRGSDADNIRIQAVAATDLLRGTPVAISRATGQFITADASYKPAAFVVGLLDSAVAAGFVGNAAPSRLTLTDWTAVTGSAQLQRGLPYFLAAGGGLTVTPPVSPSCIALVGQALDPTTLLIEPQPPIEL